MTPGDGVTMLMLLRVANGITGGGSTNGDGCERIRVSHMIKA